MIKNIQLRRSNTKRWYLWMTDRQTISVGRSGRQIFVQFVVLHRLFRFVILAELLIGLWLWFLALFLIQLSPRLGLPIALSPVLPPIVNYLHNNRQIQKYLNEAASLELHWLILHQFDSTFRKKYANFIASPMLLRKTNKWLSPLTLFCLKFYMICGNIIKL